MLNLAYTLLCCVSSMKCLQRAPCGKSSEMCVHLNTLGFLKAVNGINQLKARKGTVTEEHRAATRGQESRQKTSLEAARRNDVLPEPRCKGRKR